MMRSLLTLPTIALLAGCATIGAGTGQGLTVGSVQREVFLGMSGAEVAAVLGSPNIVTTDEFRNETWIYDKIATESIETDTLDATANLRWIESAGPFANATRTRTKSNSQRTLTVIIKFDEYQTVRDFAYHTSRF